MAFRGNSTFKPKKIYLLKPKRASKAPKTPLGTPKVKKMTLPTITKLKKRIWALLREIAFIKYGNTCYCCGAVGLVGSNRHLGHFLPSSICSTEMRYSLSNLKPSCYRCNIHLSGNWVAYESHLKSDGIDVEALKRRNEETKGLMYDRIWYKNKIVELQQELANLQAK